MTLATETEISRYHAFAAGMFKNLNCQWVKYLRFCLRYKLVALPANNTTLSWYAQFLSRTSKAHSTIVAYLSGVKKLHEITDYNTSGFKGYLLKLTMMGLRRLNMHRTRRAYPMSPSILKHIYAQLDMNKAEDAVFWCACLLSFFLLFRKSNLVPDVKFGFDPEKQLRRQDCVFTNNNIIVGIRWAKN